MNLNNLVDKSSHNRVSIDNHKNLRKSVEALPSNHDSKSKHNDNASAGDDDEINQIVFQTAPTNYSLQSANVSKFAILQDAYLSAKLRSSELVNIKVSLPLRVHSQQASKVYASIAKLLYSHLVMAKVSDIEKYIRKKASQLPTKVLNLQDWENILMIANEYRQSECIPHHALSDLKQDVELRIWLAVQAVKSSKRDINEMKRIIEKYVQDMNEEMNTFMTVMSTQTESYTKHITKQTEMLRAESNNLNKQLLDVTDKYQKMTAEKNQLEIVREDLTNKLNNSLQDCEELREVNKNLNNVHEQKCKDYDDLTAVSKSQEAQIAMLNDTVNSLQASKFNLEQNVAKLSEQLDYVTEEERKNSLKSAFYLHNIQTVMKTLESCHIKSLEALPESFNLVRYNDLLSTPYTDMDMHQNAMEELNRTEENANDESKSDKINISIQGNDVYIPSERDVMNRCKIIDMAYNHQLQSVIDNYEKKIQEIIEKTDAEKTSRDNRITELEASLEALHEKHQQLEQLHENSKMEYNSKISQLEDRIDDLVDEKAKLELAEIQIRAESNNSICFLEDKITVLLQEKISQLTAMKQLEDRFNDSQERNDSLQGTVSDQMNQIQSLQTAAQESEIMKQNLESKVMTLEAMVKQLEKDLSDSKNELHEMKAFREEHMSIVDEEIQAEIEDPNAKKGIDFDSINQNAIAIQAAARGYIAREQRKVAQLRKETLDAEAMSAALSMIAADTVNTAIESAIQSTMTDRSHQEISVQLDAASEGAAGVVDSIPLEQLLGHEDSVLVMDKYIDENSVIIIQAVTRGYIAREKIRELKSIQSGNAAESKASTNDSPSINRNQSVQNESVPEESSQGALTPITEDTIMTLATSTVTNVMAEVMKSSTAQAVGSDVNNSDLMEEDEQSVSSNALSGVSKRTKLSVADITGPSKDSVAAYSSKHDGHGSKSLTEGSILNSLTDENSSLNQSLTVSSDIDKQIPSVNDYVPENNDSRVSTAEGDKSLLLERFIDDNNVVVIQALTRGFIARARVKNMVIQQAAQEKGLLVAYQGTKQGESGWYIEDNDLYYFTLYQDQFLLLCGPLSESIFGQTIRDCSSKKHSNAATIPYKFPKDLMIDKFVAKAIRNQIENLIEEIKDKELQLELSRHTISSFRMESHSELTSIRNDYISQITELQQQVESLNSIISFKDAIIEQKNEEKLRAIPPATIETASSPVIKTPGSKRGTPGPSSKDFFPPSSFKDKEDKAAEVDEVKRLDTAELRRDLPSIVKQDSKKTLDNQVIDDDVVDKVVKFQAATRGFLARQRMEHERILLSAQESGVLVALRNTVQGESGWYSGPNGVFYFVQDNGEWILAAGPITQKTFDETRRVIKAVNPKHSTYNLKHNESFNKSFSNILSGSDGNGILLHCPFKLAFEHEDVKGEIFMSTRNEKLFIAVPVDDLILSSQPRNDENDGNNGEDNSVMTESVTIHEFTSVELGKDDNLGKNGGSLFSEPCSVCTTIEEAPFENAQ